MYGPTNVPWAKGYPTPKEMTEDDLQYVEGAFVAATKRSASAGFDFIEIHGAHGYLLHSFLSPLTNTRSDRYGGRSFENRTRFLLRVVKAVRAAWAERPLFVWLSAMDWAEGPEKDADGKWLQWGSEQTVLLAGELRKFGVDLSSGGNRAARKIPVVPGYQVPFAEAVKKVHTNVAVGSVGMITTARQANEVLAEGKANVVFLAREFLRDPHFVLRAASEFSVAVKPAIQYECAWSTVLARM